MNNRIKELAAVDVAEFLCECVRLECVGTLQVPVAEYERIRQVPTWFVVRPGHVLHEAEHVMESGDGYAVVEKTGARGLVAAELDRCGA